MVGSQSDITERKQVEEQLLFDAFYNALTGLPNRALFSTHLERVLSHIKHNQDYLFAVLLLDLDRFKFVNESFGHFLGDQLLVEVARLLKASVRENDIVAHLNGDEFVILLDGLGSVGEALAIAELIRQKLTPPIQIAGQTLFTTASIGVTLGSSQYEFSGDILRDAETAMYRAKNLGRDRYEVFETSLHTDLISRVQLETELRWAIDGHKLQIEYQPIVSLTTQKISGVEVLLRWPHPVHGFISPLNFIPLAEETGLIVPLSEWLMRTVCRQLKTWRQAGYQDLRAAVNISVRLLQNQRFPDMVQEALAETGLPASILEMEITESEAMLSDELSIPMLTRLNEMGICIAIDDFGMGYSSLSRLRLLPINIIKIDYSFVRDISSSPDAQAIIRAIIALAHSLKLSVVAEGVETREQLEFLQKLQCDFIQGYYYCPPIRAEALTQLLNIQHGKFSRV
jgi:diguanylate cyclase (GGDEF)-like protein